MHLAAEEGCVPIINILATAGAPPFPSLPFPSLPFPSLPFPSPTAPSSTTHLAAGADVNAAALEGLTALHEAARYGFRVKGLGVRG